MSHTLKPKSTAPRPTPSTFRNHLTSRADNFSGRDGLGAYIADPTRFTASEVIYYDDAFVAINDLFPKSSVHTLLLPRDPAKTLLHPFDAFNDDPVFLASVRRETQKLKSMVASELRRRYGKASAQEQARIAAMNADPVPDELPPGRDWEAQVLAGVHAGPSMSHIHVHVLSVDRYSECMKHAKHYNSFNTPFLVGLEEFPLAQGDKRRGHERGGWLQGDMTCWRCGKNFGRKFKELKRHLDEEFEEWKKE
jgi:aprataxin